jgi:hypothetical protein
VERLLRSSLTGKVGIGKLCAYAIHRRRDTRSCVLNAKKPMQGRSLTLTLASTGGL